nr:hypothetical protein [Tanacetum cinerariifolium]
MTWVPMMQTKQKYGDAYTKLIKKVKILEQIVKSSQASQMTKELLQKIYMQAERPRSTPVSTVSTHDNTANISDATMYAFLANQPNGSQLVHEDLEQIHKNDLEEIDLKWQLALLSMRARRKCKSLRNQESMPRNQASSRKTVTMEDTSSKAMVAIDGASFDWSYMADDEAPTNMALMAFCRLREFNKSEFDLATYKRGLASVEEQLVFYKKNEEFQHLEFKGFRPKDSKSVCVDTSNEIKKAPDAPIIKDWVSDSNEDESEVMGKQHKVSFKSKIHNSISQPLFMLHMDLFGPTSVSSIMHKKYCLVITDDFSRFTWVFFLATKDENIVKRFITEIENLVDKKIKIIRCDNGTEFKNRVINEFYEEKVNTACYVQNRVLVVKPHFKTAYELFKGRSPALSFMKPFGCHVTILNTLDPLGKFDGKSDEGIFVGYSIISKAFRVLVKDIKEKDKIKVKPDKIRQETESVEKP